MSRNQSWCLRFDDKILLHTAIGNINLLVTRSAGEPADLTLHWRHVYIFDSHTLLMALDEIESLGRRF